MSRAFLGADMATGVSNDLVVEDGDLAIVEGEECLRANLIDRLHTSPGGVLWNPEFGAGVLDLLGEVMSDDDLQDFAVAAKFQLEEDPRVLRVVECQATRGGEELAARVSSEHAEPILSAVGDEKTVYLRWVVETETGQVEGNAVFPFQG